MHPVWLEHISRRHLIFACSLVLMFGGCLHGNRHPIHHAGVHTVSIVIPPVVSNSQEPSANVLEQYAHQEFSIPAVEAVRLQWHFMKGFEDAPDILEMLPNGGVIRLPNDVREVVLHSDAFDQSSSMTNARRRPFEGFLRGEVYVLHIGKEDIQRRTASGSQMILQTEVVLRVK